ncbi:MAG: hypothetical protein WB797_07140 [Nocardioides sp.]
MTSYDNPVPTQQHEPLGHGAPPPHRRRRLIIAAVSAAAVVAITLPIALRGDHVFGGGDEPTTQPSASLTTPGSSAPSSTSTPSHSPSTHPSGGALDVTHLPTGALPAIGYARQGVLHLADGTTVTPATTYPVVAFTELGDGALAYLTDHDSSFAVEVTTVDGTHLGPFPSGYELVVNADRTVVAWLSRAGRPMAWQAGLTAPRSFHASIPGTSRRMAAVTGHDCTSAAGCTAYASSWQGQGSHAWAVTSHGRLTSADPADRLIWVSDASENGRIVGYTAITDTGSRSAVIDEAAPGRPVLWATTRHTLDTFSPTGEFLVAGPAYRDGIGDGQIAVYTANGRLMVSRQTSDRHPGFFQGATWEDATHVLFPIFQNDQWSLVRMSVTGTMEYAVPPAHGNMDHNPFLVETVS